MGEKFINFIKEEFISDDEAYIDTETKLLSTGIIDSFSLVSLQSFIEREFGKKIPNSKMTVENCDTINLLINLINRF